VTVVNSLGEIGYLIKCN